MALSCWVVFTARDGVAGSNAREVRLAPAVPMVRIAEPENDPERAETVTTPVATPVATPVVATEATFESDESQVTDDVMSLVVPSE